MEALIKSIEAAWVNRELLKEENTRTDIRTVIGMLDRGEIRVAEPTTNGWIVNEWIKKAVILYFPIQEMQVMTSGALTFYDKIPLKTNFDQLGVRVVPHG